MTLNRDQLAPSALPEIYASARVRRRVVRLSEQAGVLLTSARHTPWLRGRLDKIILFRS
jgi:hypothetical protein